MSCTQPAHLAAFVFLQSMVGGSAGPANLKEEVQAPYLSDVMPFFVLPAQQGEDASTRLVVAAGLVDDRAACDVYAG
jgi:hypothetical protein